MVGAGRVGAVTGQTEGAEERLLRSGRVCILGQRWLRPRWTR